MTRRFLFLLPVLLTACATSNGFHRDELRTNLGPAPEINDQEIAKALAQKPQLPNPFKLGIYFQAPEARGGHALWHWSEQDKEKILTAARKLQDAHEIAAAFELTPELAHGSDLRALRLAAAQHGADALLIVGGSNETDSYNNQWGWTYLGIVTALFVPASVHDVLFFSRASLWDVRNQFLYMSAEAESEKQQTRPAAFTDERKVVTEAKEESVAKLGEKLLKMASGLLAAR